MSFENASPLGRFGPLPGDHPAAGVTPCAICGRVLEEGDRPALVNPRPADPAEWAKAAQGKAYNAEVDLAHEACAYPSEAGE